MTVIKREALVVHTPEEMFALINDIATYPEFLPWCPESIIHEQTDTEIEATVKVKKGPIKFEFRTRNTNDAPHHIYMNLIEGPFKDLTGHWHLQPLGESGCKIEFTLQFDFNNAAIGLSLTPVMKYIADTILNAFIDRADQK